MHFLTTPFFLLTISPKGRKLRKLPSLENLERSPRKSTSPGRNLTSTPRLKAMSDRLTLFGRRKSESYLNCDLGNDQHSPDRHKNVQKRSVLGLYESRKTSECKFKCPTCYKQFRYLSNLKSHISVVHKMVYKDPKTSPILTSTNSQNKQKSYECHSCFKKFKYLSNLKTHRKVHSSLN